ARAGIRTRAGGFAAAAVVLERLGMRDGQVGQPLLVVAGRVAALGGHGGDEAVGLGERAARIVDETFLGGNPFGGVVALAFLGQRTQVEFGVTLLAPAQFAFGGGSVVGLGDDAVVFGAEPAAQARAAHFRQDQQQDRYGGEDRHDQRDQHGGGHGILLRRACGGGMPRNPKSKHPSFRPGGPSSVRPHSCSGVLRKADGTGKRRRAGLRGGAGVLGPVLAGAAVAGALWWTGRGEPALAGERLSGCPAIDRSVLDADQAALVEVLGREFADPGAGPDYAEGVVEP